MYPHRRDIFSLRLAGLHAVRDADIDHVHLNGYYQVHITHPRAYGEEKARMGYKIRG